MSNELPVVLPSFVFGSPLLCTYCGDPPTDREHVIPVCYQRTHYAARYESNGPITWSCKGCNSRLADKWFDSFDARCRWIRDRLDSKAKEIIWGNGEIAGLEYGLRVYVRKEQARRIWNRARADWYESRDYWLNIENLQWGLAGYNQNSPGTKFLLAYFRISVESIKETVYKV